jgi:hypothetical protein
MTGTRISAAKRKAVLEAIATMPKHRLAYWLIQSFLYIDRLESHMGLLAEQLEELMPPSAPEPGLTWAERQADWKIHEKGEA